MLDVLQQEVTRTGEIVSAVTPEQLDVPTPCEKFDVRALLNHLVGGQHMLVEAAAGNRPPADGVMPDVIGDDPAGAYERSSKLLLETFADPGVLARTFTLPVDMSGEQALGIAVMEAVVHRWDLATAIGVDPQIDPQLASMLLSACEGFVVDGFRSDEGHPFKPAVPVGADAAPVAKLMAFLGRAQ